MEFKLLATESGTPLARKVCDAMGRGLEEVDHKRCADGEYVPQILSNIRDTHTVMICPTGSPPEKNLLDALILGDAAVRSAPARFTMVFPYLGYNRQDRKDRSRVPVTAKLVADMISLLCPSNILFFDLHSETTIGFFPRTIKVDHLYSSVVNIQRIRELVSEPFVVGGPDKNAGPRAAIYSKLLGQSKYVLFDKLRDPASGRPDETHSKVIGDVEGCDLVLVDDMVDSGGTAILAAKTAKKAGARNVYLFVAHAVLSGDALKNLAAGPIDKVVVTDSIYQDPVQFEGSKIEVLSVAPLLARAINRIHEGGSISELILTPSSNHT